MKITIDTEKQTLEVLDNSKTFQMALYTKEAFEILSREWLKVGWNENYHYTFSWQGLPIIQLPEDLIRIQEVISQIKPDVIIETGIAYGGSLLFYASICKTLEKGRVIGIDIEISHETRNKIESHALAPFINMVEGNSIDGRTVKTTRNLIKKDDKVLVILDSKHSYKHVMQELKAYSKLVTPGSYIVATDGIMQDLQGTPGSGRFWYKDNPARAAEDFAAENENFTLEQPAWPFNKSNLKENVTHWPSAWLKKYPK
jgi:cephalosporin hydroxylase